MREPNGDEVETPDTTVEDEEETAAAMDKESNR